MPNASLEIHLKFLVTTKTAVNTMPGSEDYIANHALLTMGGRILHFEGEIKNGVLEIDHTFKYIQDTDEESYHNQMKWTKAVSTQMKNAGVNYNDPLEGMIKSHAILWIYSTYHEDSCKRGSAATKVKRCILLGSKAIDLRNTLEHSLEPESIEPDREDSNQKGRQIVCMNNYCKTTYSTCTIQSAEDKHKETNATSLAELKDGVREYIAKRAEAKKSGNTIDYRGLRYAESALAKMGVVNEIVKLQQKIMGTYCAIGINDKDLEFSDNLSSAFMSCSTFCQLYGAAVCFTDMTSIVRDRVVEYPFELCLIHTHSAIFANGLDPTTIRNMHGACNVNKLLDVYKSILTAELMDSRQAEYYSDFCLHGVEGCSELDYNLRRQPIEGFDRKSVLGERWVYQILDRKMVRYRLKLTEDQRQVCTGRNLRDGIISDDCETSASAIKAEHKTLMLIKAYMIREGFFPSDRVDDAEFLSETNHPDYMESIKACCDFLAPPSRFIQDPQQVKTDGIETGREVEYYSFEVKNKQKEGNVEIVLALANILRQFEFKLNLCMGTANGAQVGEEKKVCGHCYLILDAHYIKDGLDIRCMVEGTNWVTQHKSIDSPMKLSLAEYQMLNEVSALLMEATKLKSHNPKDDKGKGLVTMLEDRQNFYMHVYVYGDTINMFIPTDRDKKLSYGVPVWNILSRMNLKSITVGYYLVCKHLWEQMKQKVDPLEIMASVKEVAMAETVPPWPKLKWDKLLESFYPSQSLYYKEIDFDQNNDMRVVFVHQLSRAEGKDRNEFLATIRSVIADGQFPPITEKHAEMVKEKHPQLKELVFESFDPNNANSCLEGMARFIKLERVYTSMASVVTVCIVSRENLASLHSHLMQWAQIIILSRMQRETKINQEILRKLKMDIARAAADV